MTQLVSRWSISALFIPALIACGGETTPAPDGSSDTQAQDTVQEDTSTSDICSDATGPTPTGHAYSFPSNLAPFEGVESVSYSGQSMRQVLIEDLKSFIGGLTGAIDQGDLEPTDDGEIVGALTFYYDFDAASDGDAEIGVSTDPTPVQTTYNDLETKNLKGKFAGNDSKTDHKVWAEAFQGWNDATIAAHGGDNTTPEGLLTAYFETIEENAIGRAKGVMRFGVDANGNLLDDTLPVHVTEAGQDLQQLVQKFLSVAVAFSQGTDDYLDDDVEDKGLLVSNGRDGCKPYSKLMHHWDEAFGYYGAARDNDAYKASEIAGKCVADETTTCDRGSYFDSNGDGAIDLKREYNFGHSQNAAKRTHGSKTGLDLKSEIFESFVAGRALIHSAGETLSDQELATLKGHRDVIATGWEKALAATVVHYINDVLGDMEDFGTEGYAFLNHAKHWSELKGFALGFQFNPRSPLSEVDFAAFHAKVGDAPVLPGADTDHVEAYKLALAEARALLQGAYQFSAEDVDGW